MKLEKIDSNTEHCLHDCLFYIEQTNDEVKLIFPEGYIIEKGNENVKVKKGMIMFVRNNFFDVLEIRALCHKTTFGKNYIYGKYLSTEELTELFKDGLLWVVDEYHSYKRLFLRCNISPYKKPLEFKVGETIEIEIFHENPLEYFVSDEYRKYEG